MRCHPKYFELLYFLSHFCELLKCDMGCDTLSISNYFIFCLIFMKYLNLGTCQKMKYFHKNHIKMLRITEMPICVSLVASTCNQNITLITAHTTLTPTRKLKKEQYFHSSFHFGYSVSYFWHAPLVYRLVSRARKLKCGWVVIISNSRLVSGSTCRRAIVNS
jgi:hypothetical protein